MMEEASETASHWFEVALAVRDADVDAATGLLDGLGFGGSEVVELGAGRTELRVSFQARDQADAHASTRELARALGELVALTGIRALDESVWRDDWKRHFDRMTVGRRFEILPPWDSEPAGLSDRIAIVINPGMAFGTGRHETTARCLELLESFVHSGKNVLDLGCGSGILAIAAAKLGATRVLGIDNDPEAVNAANENTAMNGVQNRVEIRLDDGPPGAAAGTFDVVVSNILAEPLAEMAPALTSCVKHTGVLVLSGIESKRRRLVEVAYGRQGWRVTRDVECSGWVSLALERREDVGARNP